MNDRSWMLNPNAIRIAKECIQLVKEELDIKLLLSHPDFIEMLHEYVELTESAALNDAYSRLIAFAGPGQVIKSLSDSRSKKVVSMTKRAAGEDVQTIHNTESEEMVDYGGKKYALWQDGKKFSGVYRGRPYYS